jgi:hypothetical protein
VSLADRLPSPARWAPFLPAALVLAIWVAWIPADGGYFPRSWYPAGLFGIGLLAAAVAAGARWRTRSRLGPAALVLLAAFVAWNFASMLWAGSPGSAWEAADQLLLYLVMTALVALVPWGVRSAMLFVGCWSVAVSVACLVVLVGALGATHFGHYVLVDRWQQPTGYANTAAAVASMAFWPALVLSTARRIPAVLQVALLAAAAFLLDFSFLPESRASLVVVLVVPIVVAFAPERGRLLARIGVIVIAAAVAIGPAYDVYSAAHDRRPLAPVVHSAAEAMVPSVAIAALGALLLVLVERRVKLTPRTLRRARGGALAVLAVALLAGAGVAIANDSAISHYARERWDAFKSDSGIADARRLRITQQSSDKRYDYWRVSLDMFSAAPLVGAGAGNFEREYDVHRRHAKPSRSAHSIWMRTIGELGGVGLALLVACVSVSLLALVQVRRRLDAGARTVLCACVGVSAYFVAHASFDWLELLPALAAPALALPFVALRLEPTATAATAARLFAGRRARLLVAAGGGLAVAAALVSLALPYLSSRYVQSALHRARSDPAGARRDLDRAASLDSLSPDPRYAAAGIALDQSRFGDARRAFEQALDVEDGWYPHFGLALLDSRARKFAAARREIARARALDAQDPLVIRAAMLIAERKRLDPRAVDRKTLALPLYKDLRHQ